MNMRAIFLLTVWVALTLPVPVVFAAGSRSSSTRPAPPSNYDAAVKAVKAGNFSTSIRLLEKVVARDPRNADAFNYLGFSHRKLGEFDKAFGFYRKALAIDPEHKGAHEYIGETYLAVKDVAKAKAHLARLDKICWLGCGEYDDLKKAIAQHEKNSKRQ